MADLELWEPRDLYETVTDNRLDDLPDHFLTTYFGGAPLYSNDRKIWVRDLPAAHRQLAPFSFPSVQGKPIFKTKGEKAEFYEPPYIKPKDAVRPEDMKSARPEEIFGRAPLTMQQRFDIRVTEVMDFHQRAIRMQECWMAARAFIDGKVVIQYQPDQGTAYPEVTIDYGRDAGQTIVLSTTYWDDPDYPILDDIQAWGNTMHNAVRGGFPVRIYVGSAVAPCLGKNKQIIAQQNTLYRGNDSNVNTGIIQNVALGQPIVDLGTVGAGIKVFAFKDVVEDSDGTLKDILDPKEVVLVASGATGTKAYGAIYDVDAIQGGQSAAIDIFPKMFKSDDPSAIFLMNQSAPLPIMLYPNRTLKAKVLA